MFPSLNKSMESFVSPTAVLYECESASGAMRLRQGRKDPLPHIPKLLVKRSATVSVRLKGLARWIWNRQELILTNHTLSLHKTENSPALEIIVLRKVTLVERANLKPYCLWIQTTDDRHYYFAFDEEAELYHWLTEIQITISTVSEPTNFQHVMHVKVDENDKSRLIGMPEEWQQAYPMGPRDSSVTLEMIEAALPEISFTSQDEPIIDFDCFFTHSRPGSSDLYVASDDEEDAIIMVAQKAVRPTTQRLLDIRDVKPEKQPLKIVIQDFSSQPPAVTNLLSASEGSPSTPVLTPDTSPLTPFRESPNRYRESDAQNLTGQIHKQGQWADAHGGYADIWRAQWQTDMGNCFPVAVKVLRVLGQDEKIQKKIQRRLRNEVRVWHQLRHKNVVQMFGVCDGFGPFVSMVSLWCENGNVNAYLRKLGEGATIERRLKLLTEVAAGLNYLHNFAVPVVHGDVKGANILVNDQGEAALADFGLSSILEAEGSATSTGPGGSARWMAPELLQLSPHNVTPKTCASDTYSYGSVILEVLTGERPYKDISNDMQVINQLIRGSKPKRPSKPIVDPGIWDLMERCWATDVTQRPSMALMLLGMEKFYLKRIGSMLPEDKLAFAL